MKQQKRKMQVSLSILLAAVMLIGMCAVLPVTAAGAKTSGDYEYENINDGTVRITGYTGTDDIITIPLHRISVAVTHWLLYHIDIAAATKCSNLCL